VICFLDITNRILRKENYMVAMMNQGILDISLPKWMRPWDDDDSQTGMIFDIFDAVV